jgi:putative membrane protein
MTTEPEPGRGNGQLSDVSERTMLAWIRTSLGLTIAGLAISQLLPPFGFACGHAVSLVA